MTSNLENEYHPIVDFADWYGREYRSDLVDRYEARFRAFRSDFTQAELDRASEVVRRYAAIDTGAIEGLYKVDRGFTKTVATQTAAWQSALQAKGEFARKSIEDAIEAYEYILDVTTGAVPISEMWIRSLHEVICRSQDEYEVETEFGREMQPLPKGTYKVYPNSPTNLSTGRLHHYAPPIDTPKEMDRLVLNLRSEDFERAHPVLQAAYAHYAYVCIHPFADGNGRVARALASAYLYRIPGVPLLVFADQRDLYLDSLESADAGDLVSFVSFIQERAIDAVGLLEASLLTARKGRSGVAPIEALQSLFGASPGMAKARDLGARLRALCMRALEAALQSLSFPDAIEVSVVANGVDLESRPGFVAFGSSGWFRVWARSEYPRKFQVRINFQILMRAEIVDDGEPDFVLAPAEPLELEVWSRELDPLETESLRLRVRLWAESAADMVAESILREVN